MNVHRLRDIFLGMEEQSGEGNSALKIEEKKSQNNTQQHYLLALPVSS